jgi:hypothetical protein
MMVLFDLEDSQEIEKRKKLLADFVGSIFDNDEEPYFVSDKATLYDIYLGDIV